MLTYQIRPRNIKIEGVRSPLFPCTARIRCHFSPVQPFGGEATGGRTAKRATPASAFFDANTGKHYIESTPPLEKLALSMEYPASKVSFSGSVFEYETEVESFETFVAVVEGFYYRLPPLLSIQFADPPIIDRVDGFIDTIPFRWELAHWIMGFDITTVEQQTDRARSAIDHFFRFEATDRRLVAALQYFHIACRLDRVGNLPGEFLAESLLNFAKVLEVLFPPTNGQKSRDAIRDGLSTLGYSEIERERDFLPAIALRNEVDVGHVDLALFNGDQLQVLHQYAGRAEIAFKELMLRLMSQIITGRFAVVPWEHHTTDVRTTTLIERLRTNLSSLSQPAV